MFWKSHDDSLNCQASQGVFRRRERSETRKDDSKGGPSKITMARAAACRSVTAIEKSKAWPLRDSITPLLPASILATKAGVIFTSNSSPSDHQLTTREGSTTIVHRGIAIAQAEILPWTCGMPTIQRKRHFSRPPHHYDCWNSCAVSTLDDGSAPLTFCRLAK